MEGFMQGTRYIVLFAFALCLTASPLLAQPQRVGLGFAFGEPTGISWEYRLNQTNSIEGAIGFSPFDQYRVHADYVWRSYPFQERSLGVYYGVGAVIGFGRTGYVIYDDRYGTFFRNQDADFGIRAPLGLSYLIPGSPVNVYGEIAPMMIFAPGTGLGIDGGLGLRFFL